MLRTRRAADGHRCKRSRTECAYRARSIYQDRRALLPYAYAEPDRSRWCAAILPGTVFERDLAANGVPDFGRAYSRDGLSRQQQYC